MKMKKALEILGIHASSMPPFVEKLLVEKLLVEKLSGNHATLHRCPEHNVFCLTCGLHNLVMRPVGSQLDSSEIVKNIELFSNNFRKGKQEDAHEFLHCVFSQLSEDLVDSIFGGTSLTTVKCRGCKESTKIRGKFNDLTIPIDSDSLLDGLKNYFKPESVRSTCSTCGGDVKDKNLEFEGFPTVLIVNLNRFYTTKHGIPLKNENYVEFPLELDMMPFASQASDHAVFLQECKYNLHAFVEHLGSSVDFGHYICYVRISEKMWILFDDEKVIQVNQDDVLLKCPYLLFYIVEKVGWFDSFKRSRPEHKKLHLNYIDLDNSEEEDDVLDVTENMKSTSHSNLEKCGALLDVGIFSEFILDVKRYNRLLKRPSMNDPKKVERIRKVYDRLKCNMKLFQKLTRNFRSKGTAKGKKAIGSKKELIRNFRSTGTAKGKKAMGKNKNGSFKAACQSTSKNDDEDIFVISRDTFQRSKDTFQRSLG